MEILAVERYQRTRAKRDRWVCGLFYVLLVLVNVGILLIFGAGGFTEDLVRFFSEEPAVKETAESYPDEFPDQYPPGENWYGGTGSPGVSVQKTSQ